MSYGCVDSPTDGPNITGGVQFQLLTPTNVNPPVFQLTCTSTSSPPTTVQWTINRSLLNGNNYASTQIMANRPTSTYNNSLIVTGRAPGTYTCNVTTTCSPVCGFTGFTLYPRSIAASLSVSGNVSTAYEGCLVPIHMYLYTGPPAPPMYVTVVQTGPTSVTVSWTAPTSGDPVSRYDIYYVANGVPSASGGSTTNIFYVLSNLQVGVQYNISVVAVGTYLPSQSADVILILSETSHHSSST